MSKPNEDMGYKVAIDLAGRAAKKLFEAILDANGIPIAAGQSATALFTQYGKQFMKVVLAAVKYEAALWSKTREASILVQRHIQLIEHKIAHTPVPSVPPIGVFGFYGALIDSRAAHLLSSEIAELKRLSLQVVEGLDALELANAEIMEYVVDGIKYLDKYQATDRPRNVLEHAFNAGSIPVERDSWCQMGLQLISLSASLAKHRNDWARLATLPPRNPKIRKTLEGYCFVP